MTHDITPTQFENSIGEAPSPKQNLIELETGAFLASDIPNVNVSETATAIHVAGHSANGMPAPNLYVPALSQPSHKMRFKDRSGTWFEMANSVDLRHFGDVVDNRGSDIGPALTNFVDYAREKGGGSVMIPPGIYSLESPVSEVLDQPNDNFAIGIFGQGTEVSRIVVDGASVNHGPKFSSNNRAGFFQFESFSILADGTVNGRPLEATLPLNGGARRNCSHIVRDILVQGYDNHILSGAPYNDHFTKGFNFTGAWRMMFENIHMSGPVPSVGVKVLNDWSDSSILWRMQDGLVIDGAYAPVVRDVQFYFVANPVICRGHPSGAQDPGVVEAERALFQNVRCPTCKTGINWFRTGAEPELVITDCFFDYRDRGIQIKGSRLGQVFRNAFFQKTTTGAHPTVPMDIRLEHCIDFVVDHNLHHELGDERRIGVALYDTSTAAGHRTEGIEIRRNRVSEVCRMAAYLIKGANTGTAVFEPGVIAGTVNTLVNDGPASTKVELDLVSPYTLSASASSASQTVANDTWAAVAWDAVSHADDTVVSAWDVGTADQVIVPSDKGLSHAQLRVTTSFASNNTGVRQLRVLKNGVAIEAGLTISGAAAPDADTTLHGVTDWIAVAAGDILTVEVRQTSGAPLTLEAPSGVTVSFR